MPKTYELLPNENNPMFAAGCIGMLITTFYEKSGIQESNSLSCLHERMREILKQNPWLMGRAKLDQTSKKIVLELDDGVEKKVDDYILKTEDDQIFGHDSLNGMREAFSGYRVKPGSDLVDKDSPLARLGIIENQNRSKLCIFISISHMIADACTFYSIYKMLDMNQPVISLNRSPVPNFMNFTRNRTSIFPNKGVSEEPWTDLLNFKQTVIGPLAMKAEKKRQELGTLPSIVFARVNSTEIEKEKAKWNNDGRDFVSTNDCLVSMLASIHDEADCIDFAMTLRGRVPNVGENDAGNYITIPLIRKSDLATPKTVRLFLTNRLNPEKSWNYPESISKVNENAGGITTNWATFYHEVEIPGFKQKIHLPVISSLTKKINGMELCPTLAQVILKVNKDELACLMITGVHSSGRFE